jgi:pyruvate formate lyase activating enzyme
VLAKEKGKSGLIIIIDDVRGIVFNIQHYSIHDGPGIRTTVFVNGCPLRCLWCQNPESQSKTPRLFFSREKCTGCGQCLAACPQEAIRIVDKVSQTDRSLCKGCGQCTLICPNEARNIMGKEMTAKEVFKDVISDEVFYKNSGGGVTISGGEPLSQPEFVTEILKLCKNAGLHTVVDTSGYADWDTFKQVLAFTDMVLYDFKHMNPEEHRRFTGVSNELILDNARKIIKEFPKITFVARMPVIPGYNDSNGNIVRTALFITEELGESVKVNILPYHRLGETKYERLELASECVRIKQPSDKHMEELRSKIESFGLSTSIGG